jgi:AmmeMemoRadiSam system protein B
MQKEGKTYVALRDPTMLMKQTMVVPTQAMQIIQLFQGKRTLEELAEQINGNLDQLIELAKGLDNLGLLWGPTFERMEKDRWEELQKVGSFPARASQMLGEDDAACRHSLQEYFDQTDDPELEFEPTAIVAPHLDYERGWPNYAAAYYALRDRQPPERVVVLGTNHFGLGDGVVLSELGFGSPMGRCPADRELIEKLVGRLGRPIIADQLDHLAEYSIELQLPWLQYCFGEVPIVGVLMPDPLVGLIAEDGERVDLQPFVETLGEVLSEIGGSTFFVASADLSHVGPHFGEPRRVDDQRRFDVERHDRDMMSKFLTGDSEEFLAAMRWNKNPTRWCSVGNMAAVLMLTRPEQLELIDYRQAVDEHGTALVSSAGMAMG